MRQGTYNGSTGFGWEKVQRRHAIYSKHSVGYVIKNPNGGTPQGTQRLYKAWANYLVCTPDCIVWSDREVRVVNETARKQTYYGVDLLNQNPGVLTAYCINPHGELKCPSWVDKAIGAHAPRPRTDANESEHMTVWSYTPITNKQLASVSAGTPAKGLMVR